MEEQQQQAEHDAQQQHPPASLAIVSAGESEQDGSDDEHWMYGDPSETTMQPDDLYGQHLDTEDEAWVYKHMRGGTEETVTIKKPGKSQLEQAKLLKPRTSDAVLSCPCCFAIVCMDCQRHERYSNQYRAMFVMNIGVDWSHKLVYCDKTKGLVDKPPTPSHHVPPEKEHLQEKEYYKVFCSSCRTQVAALDMEDEVYHFFGCLASA